MTALLHSARHAPRRRHRLLAPSATAHWPAAALIPDIDSLRGHLQTAIELEHSTIPPYLCALYTMDAERNTFASRVLQGVVMEEMLHMLLAANLLNAVHGEPAINRAGFIPDYPTFLPHSDQRFQVGLNKFSAETMEVFLRIEKPAAQAAPPQADKYHSIGQFYAAIGEALVRLDGQTAGGIFTGDPARQLQASSYYGGGGQLLPVHTLDDALEAIAEIVGQGEGMQGQLIDPDQRLFGQDIEYAHFYRYNEVRQGRRYAAHDAPDDPPSGPPVAVCWDSALDMRPNPRMADHPEGSPLWRAMHGFNRVYSRLLDEIHQACNGRGARLAQAVPLMYELKYQALALLQTPDGTGRRAGPSFEYLPPG